MKSATTLRIKKHALGIAAIVIALATGYFAGQFTAYRKAYQPNMFAAVLNNQMDRVEQQLNLLENQHQNLTQKNREYAAAELVLAMDQLLRHQSNPVNIQHWTVAQQTAHLMTTGQLSLSPRTINESPRLAQAYRRLENALAD